MTKRKSMWLAAIAPCESADWATDRTHYLFASRDEAEAEGKEAIWDAFEENKWYYTDWDVAWIDPDDIGSADFPSAGDPNCWEDDVWNGIADYLSFVAFGWLVKGRGKEYNFGDYVFPDWNDLARRRVAHLSNISWYLPHSEKEKVRAAIAENEKDEKRKRLEKNEK